MSGEEKGKGIERPPKYLSAQQVADRYGLTIQWVYHCEGLRAIAKKFGKYLKYREDLLIGFEESRSLTKGYPLPQMKRDVMRNMSETTKIAANRKSLIFDIKD